VKTNGLWVLAVWALASVLHTTEARAAPPAPHVAVQKADWVLVVKSMRRLFLLKDGKVIRSYRVALGRQPLGHKFEEGDGRTPEGIYFLNWRNPNSQFYRSIHVSYPNAFDLARPRRPGASPGGLIMVHGLPNGDTGFHRVHTRLDWTNGCIAVTNAEMDEIWALVDDGTPIEIRP
jgi:murein L,D-transpeptidase YafK